MNLTTKLRARRISNFSLTLCLLIFHSTSYGAIQSKREFSKEKNTIALWHMDALHSKGGFNQVYDETGNFTLQQSLKNKPLLLVKSVGGSGNSITGFSNDTGGLDLHNAAHAGLSDSAPQTFEAWIKWENDYFLPKRRASIKQTVMARLVSSSSSAWLYFVNNQIKLSIRSGDGRRDEKIYTAVANPKSGVWYHVAFTIEVGDFDQQGDKKDTRVKLYFNDANNTDTTPEPLENISTRSKDFIYEDFEYRANGWLFRLGKRYGKSNADFRGYIDDVRLSNIAKTTFDVFGSVVENEPTPTDPVEETPKPTPPVAESPEPTPPVEETPKPVDPVVSRPPPTPTNPDKETPEPTEPVTEAPEPTEPNTDISKFHAKHSFVVMQSLLFDANKPSNEEFLKNFGISYLPEFGHGFGKNWDIANGANPFYDEPSEKLVKQWARNAPTNFGFLDIEHLPVTSFDDWDDDWNHKTPNVKITDTDRKRAIREMAAIADWAHAANPSLKIGYYGVLPQREYWSFILPDQQKERLAQLKKRNEMFKALASHVEVLFPSLYTFYDKPEEWKIYAKGMIEEARKYNKPTYAFIWPKYHPSNQALGGQFIAGDFWRVQLEELYKLGYDGVVIWGGWKEQWNQSASDKDPGNWWYQTLDFMKSKGILPDETTWKPTKLK